MAVEIVAKLSKLDLCNLCKPPGLPALTPAQGTVYSNAAGICLEHNGHACGRKIDVDGMTACAYALHWPTITDQIRRAHNDMQDATRDGAYAIAIALAISLTKYTIVLQSRKGTGFDYWLGKSKGKMFDNAARLEVSGILDGTDMQINSRVKQKKQQTDQSNETIDLPAYVCVIEFSRPLAHFAQR